VSAELDAAKQAYLAACAAHIAARRVAGGCGGMQLGSPAVTATREVVVRAQRRLWRVRAAERAALVGGEAAA